MGGPGALNGDAPTRVGWRDALRPDGAALPRRVAGIAVAIGLAGLMTVAYAPALSLLILSGYAIATAIATAVGDRHTPSWSREDRLVLALLLALPLLHLLNMALLGWDLSRFDIPSRLLFAALAFVALRRTGVDARLVFWSALAGAIAAGAVAYAQTRLIGLPRALGAVHPIPFGNTSLLLGAVVIAGWLLLYRGARRWHVLPAVAFAVACALWASFASGARGGWIALPLFAYVLALSAPRLRLRHRLAAVAATLALMGLAFVAVPPLKVRVQAAVEEVQRFVERAPGASGFAGSVGTRLEMWRVGIEMFGERPWLGTGLPGFRRALSDGVRAGTIDPELLRHQHLHNELIDTGAKFGIVGLAVLGCFVFGFWRRFRRAVARDPGTDEARFFGVFGLLSIGGFAVFALSDSLYGTPPGMHALGLLLALGAAGISVNERPRAD